MRGLIVTSRTYPAIVARPSDLVRARSDNTALARQARLRLAPAEAVVRDAGACLLPGGSCLTRGRRSPSCGPPQPTA